MKDNKLTETISLEKQSNSLQTRVDFLLGYLLLGHEVAVKLLWLQSIQADFVHLGLDLLEV